MTILHAHCPDAACLVCLRVVCPVGSGLDILQILTWIKRRPRCIKECIFGCTEGWISSAALSKGRGTLRGVDAAKVSQKPLCALWNVASHIPKKISEESQKFAELLVWVGHAKSILSYCIPATWEPRQHHKRLAFEASGQLFHRLNAISSHFQDSLFRRQTCRKSDCCGTANRRAT